MVKEKKKHAKLLKFLLKFGMHLDVKQISGHPGIPAKGLRADQACCD